MRYLKQDALAKLSRAASIVDLAAERGLDPQVVADHAVARCPFCSARALILERTNRFHCTSCSEGGNAFGLVCRMDRVSFMGSLRRVAAHAGLDFDELLTDHCECPVCMQRTTVPLWALTPLGAC